MALTQPVLNQIPAFDATLANTIYFSSVGGDQVIGNRIIIRNNQTGSIVYNAIEYTYRFEHTIPANTLTNNTYYNVTVSTLNFSEVESSPSVPLAFRCYTTPLLTVSNVSEDDVIEQSTFEFTGNYSQTEGELLNGYKFILYDSNQAILSQSDILYTDTIAYTFIGFSNNTQYYIELQGTTVNNTEITSGKIKFTVQYITPSLFAISGLENQCDSGSIQISSNIVAIDGTSNPNPPDYVDNDKVSLLTDGSWVKWLQGYNIKDDFTLRIWGSNFVVNKSFLTISNKLDSEFSANKIEAMMISQESLSPDLPDYSGIFNGTDVTITDAVDEPTLLTGFECSSVQTKTYKNELLNSGFVTTVNPWEARAIAGATVTIDTAVYLTSPSSFKMVFTAGGYTIYKQLISFISTHKYYIKVNGRNTNAVMGSFGARIYSTNTTLQNIQIAVAGINTWKSASVVYTANGTETDIDTMASMGAGEVGTAYIDDIQLIDLTAHFGAGNEPTQAWCDANITYDSCWAMDMPNTIYNTGDGGVLNVWAHKKNMFDKSVISNTSDYVLKTTNGLKLYKTALGRITPQYKLNLPANINHYFSCDVPNNTTAYTIIWMQWITDIGTTIWSPNLAISNNKVRQLLNFPNNIVGYRMYLQVIEANGVYIEIDNIQVEQGTVATPYEPYTGAEYPITLPAGYVGGSLPNLVKDDYKFSRLGKVVLNGSEIWNFSGTSNATYLRAFTSSVNAKFSTITISDKFKYGLYTVTDGESLGSISATFNISILNSRLGVLGTDTNTQKVDKLKTWLALNPVTVIYELANPISITPTLPSISTYEDYMVLTSMNYPKANLIGTYATGYYKEYWEGIQVLLRCWSNNNSPYIVTSNILYKPKTTDQVFIWLRRENNLFDIKLENLGGTEFSNNTLNSPLDFIFNK